MQKTLTSFDIAATVLELKEKLKGARLQNIYQIGGNLLIMKLHKPNQPPLQLLVESGKRLHLTSYVLKKPQKPPAFCMVLRKYLRNSTFTDISQCEFERIVVIRVRTKEGESKLVLELFGDGNVILVDSDNIIRQALVFKKMRDRNVLRGEVFQQPPSSGKSPLNLKLSDLLELREFKGLEVVKALTKFLSIGGMYAEEILLRAKMAKDKKCEDLKNGDFDALFKALNEIVLPLETGNLEPCIIIDENGELIDAVPFKLKKYDGFKYRAFGSFNEALDEYYAKTVVEREVTEVTKKAEQKIARQQRILREQQELLEKARQEAEQFRKVGDIIYAHFHELQIFLQQIMDEKRSGKAWEHIVSNIEEEKKSGKAPSVYFESLDTKNLVLNLSFEDLAFSLMLRDSIQKNAATYYDRAKKAERKLEGAEKAIEETLGRIEELEHQKEVAIEETDKPIKKRRKKAWYEKFRWFYTSENLLVVGGKDAVTNEILIKKHTEPHDIVFHADIAGAPFVIIKTEGKTPSQQSISEASQLAASHSRAWKAKFSAIDVYWVHSEQVSKTPPTGEYLPRGAFMIRGKKNYIRKTPVRLAIGVDPKTTPPTLIGGPKEAVQSRTNILMEIVPGDLPSSKLANKVKQELTKKTAKNLQEKVAKIPIDKIQAFIPFGKGRIGNQIKE